MNKYEFMYRLDKGLSCLDIDDREEILMDYEDHFRLGAQAGKTEEEIINDLGDPDELANSYVTPEEKEIFGNDDSSSYDNTQQNNILNYSYPKSEKKDANVLVIIAIVLISIFIVLPLFSTLISIVFGIFCSGIGSIIGGLVVIVALSYISSTVLSVAGSIILGLGLILLGIVLGFIGVYASYGLWKLGKWYYMLCKRALEEI